jgi:hypothetical protein
MTGNRSTSDDLYATVHLRLHRLAEELRRRDRDLAAAGADAPYEHVRAAALGTAVLAVQYARQTVATVLGNVDAEARDAVGAALRAIVEEHQPQPWGDSALSDLDNITDRSARLLADVWMLGRLTVAADPASWSTETLVQQCLQVVAETHLAGKLRAELDGMFGETDEPGEEQAG